MRKNQYSFRRKRSTTSQILIICRTLDRVHAKNLEATLLSVDFSKAFDSIHIGKTEQILLAYGRPKETVTAIMILYKNTNVKVLSLDGDKLLWHCCWCSARRYICSMSVHNLLRLRTSNVDRFQLAITMPRKILISDGIASSNVERSSERKWFLKKRQEADDTSQKLLRKHTRQMA